MAACLPSRKTASSFTNSPAILKYLSAKHPERGLCGGDAKTQALVDQWICWWVGGAEAAMDALAWEMLIKPKVLNQPGNDPGIMADARARLARFLPVLDEQLAGRDYILGPLSVVDFLIGPRFDVAPSILNIDMSPYKNITPGSSGCAPSPIGRTLEAKLQDQRTSFFDLFMTSLPLTAAILGFPG